MGVILGNMFGVVCDLYMNPASLHTSGTSERTWSNKQEEGIALVIKSGTLVTNKTGSVFLKSADGVLDMQRPHLGCGARGPVPVARTYLSTTDQVVLRATRHPNDLRPALGLNRWKNIGVHSRPTVPHMCCKFACVATL